MPDKIEGPVEPQLTSNSPEQAAPAEPQSNPFEETINRLVGVTKKASEDVQMQRQDNNEIRSALAALAQQVEALRNTPGNPAPAGNPPQAPSNSGLLGQPPASGPGAPLDEAAILGIVEKALNQHATLTNEALALQQTQRDCYQECLAELPTIADVNSPEGQAFNRIYAGRPDLQAMPDGPRIAMILARDAANQGRRDGRDLAGRKDRARVLQDASPRGEVTDSQLKALQERHQALVEKGNKHPLSDAELGEYLDSKLALTNAKAQGLIQ